MRRSLLAAAALVPLALGDFSYDYNVPTASPTMELSEAPTTAGTFGACPIIEAVAAGSETCPLGNITCPPECLDPCDQPGLRAGQLCYVFVPDEAVRRRLTVVATCDVPPGEPCCDGEEILPAEEACEYIINEEEARRRLQGGGKFVVQQVVADATGAPTVTEAPTRTETYAPTRMTEAPSYAPTTDTYAPTMAPTATGVPTFTDAPTGAPTNATNAPTPPARRRLEATVPLPVSKSFHRSGGAHTEARRRLQALSS